MRRQTTLKKEINFSGKGLHTGKAANLTVKPALPGTGIVFFARGRKITASAGNTAAGAFSITIRSGAAKVMTAEHLLAALFAMGVDNAACYLDACEVPALDGSSYPFAAAIKKAGLRKLKTAGKAFRIRDKITVKDGDRSISALPPKGLKISCRVSYPHPLIGEQKREFTVTPERFLKEIAKARTFGWSEQVKLQKKKGLIMGAGVHNAVYFKGNRILNKEGLRFKDEVVRHKVLDIIGALALLPGRPEAHIIADKSGHALDLELIRRLTCQNSRK